MEIRIVMQERKKRVLRLAGNRVSYGRRHTYVLYCTELVVDCGVSSFGNDVLDMSGAQAEIFHFSFFISCGPLAWSVWRWLREHGSGPGRPTSTTV